MKNKLFLFIFLILSIYFLSCQQTSTAPKETESASTEEEKKENKDTFSVSIISNREIYTDQFTGAGEYKSGEKVTIKMNWLDKGDNFIGFYDDAYNELDKNQFFSFFMPCHDCIVNALFYKEGDKPLKVGDYVFFGMYPRTRCTGESDFTSIRNSIDYSSMNQFEFYESGKIVKDTYYYYDFYLEEEYLNKKFRYIEFKQSDPHHRMYDCNTTYDATSGNNDSSIGEWDTSAELDYYQKENGLSTGYYFYEPLKWRILSINNGKAMLIATEALDSQQFYHSLDNHEDGENGTTIYPNNWEYSDIRKWLNNDFYNTAFTKGCANYIQETQLDNVNTSFFRGSDGTLQIGKNSSTENQNNTIDKIFLPSVKDCSTAEYGFYTDDDGWDPARKFLPTQYSKAMGIRVYHGFYEFSDKWNIFSEARAFGYATHVWTRSGSNNWGSFILQSGIPSNHQGILVMNCLGDIEELIYTSRTFVGVAPALVVSLE